MNEKKALRSLLADTAVVTELQRSTTALESVRAAALRTESIDSLFTAVGRNIQPGNYTKAEAIILLHGRPALLIQDGKWQKPTSDEIAKRLNAAKEPLIRAIPKVGRVEILDYETDYVGTGWMIAEDILITNRHVAQLFGTKRGSGFSFRKDELGRDRRVRVDFLREYDRTAVAPFEIKSIVFIEDDDDAKPDFALVRVGTSADTLPAPIELDSGVAAFNDDVAVIGYPARDYRNDSFVMDDIFGRVYNVKRLSPGRIVGVQQGRLIEHDCTTLGGNSGSVVLNLSSGKACGLHFSGTYRVRNLAVSAAWLRARLSEVTPVSVSVPEHPGAAAPGAVPEKPAPDLTGRKGYQPKFLGTDHAVALPEIPAGLRTQIAPVKGRKDGRLDYTHFSIVLRKDRRMPFFTACNIDGDKLFNFVRGTDRWFFDDRLAAAHQIGPEIYEDNPLDRGHLVRRLDPAWGSDRKEAKSAEADTFYFTNCTPQHSRLNQRTWLSLEEYILGNAATHELKVTIFCGPVMTDEDRPYRGIKLPAEFWKVAVIVNADTGELSATGYIISQADYLKDMEFVYGEFKTYQVPLALIEAKTKLKFGLGEYDPLARVETGAQREICTPSDLVL